VQKNINKQTYHPYFHKIADAKKTAYELANPNAKKEAEQNEIVKKEDWLKK
jgi:hypothetical protein